MNKVVSCATFGFPISPGAGLFITKEGVRHADWLVCVAALKAERERLREELRVVSRYAARLYDAAEAVVSRIDEGLRSCRSCRAAAKRRDAARGTR